MIKDHPHTYPVLLIVTEKHKSEYPDPIVIEKGDLLHVGEKYNGSEGWDNWYFCSAQGKSAGWVPGQYIELLDNSSGLAAQSYSAAELNVEAGEKLWGTKELNGWIWCQKPFDGEEGWVPVKNVKEIK